MSYKLLIVCGPTATGKTSLAIQLAKKFNGEIVSADSRQVYKGMDIGTGKEWGDVPIWGYDIADPKREFSISHYLKFAKKIILDVTKRGKLPILVGGTGFYVKGAIDGIPTVTVPRSEDLRRNLEKRTPDELFEMLAQMDSFRAGQMNSSDKKNPRRLIRAIEVATWKLEHGEAGKPLAISNQPLVLMIGLTAPKDFLNRKISKRVAERVKMGIKKEIAGLIKSGVDWNDQSMQALGYREWRDYFEGLPAGRQGAVPEKLVIDEWIRDEQNYTKRQMTWFKKDKRIIWFDITVRGFSESIEKLVRKWYSTRDANKS